MEGRGYYSESAVEEEDEPPDLSDEFRLDHQFFIVRGQRLRGEEPYVGRVFKGDCNGPREEF
ncbi:MAG: hypothetical protein KKE05_05125 [Nanoarchaeota archaeon]|nr:hypothetical protein [Nanoarchaeota archaeon]